MLYSPSRKGFFDPKIHDTSVPADAVSISDATHAALMAGQAQGKIIVPGANGAPVLADPAVAAADEAMVTRERDRRLRGSMAFAGQAFQCDLMSLIRITGAASLAGTAIAVGAQPGDLRWHGGSSDFVWIATDNSIVPMDAQTMFAFGREAAQRETAFIQAGRALKETSPIPANFTDNSYWP